MILNLPKRDANREVICEKLRPIIGLRGTWKNFELYPWGKYEIFEAPPLEICPLSSFQVQMLKKYEENVKEYEGNM